MKRLLVLFMLISVLQAKAGTHIISVSNFQFTPSNLNVAVGDVIRWQWASGFHNTASLTVPAGADTWASPYLTATGDYFEYTVVAEGPYEYYCDIHGVSMSGSFTASAVVPVSLSIFTVSNKSNRPHLSWTTQSESNSAYFAVHRSYDGNIFTEIGRVPAAGNSAVAKNYSFTDAGIKSNAKYVYYELAITDKDENVQLSPIKLFKNNESIKKLITSLSPNPVSEAGHLLIQFNADFAGKLMARITDITGKLVLVSELSAAVGVNNGHIHIADLASGNYVVQFNLNGVMETYKIRKK
ncbi:MAG TPA: T9SS type A sorting domain-containing protein [Ferruginibacter sp.]|nr:T9SS type A sorting domain-containing protein [Ferruginibacter sp.]